MNSYARAAAPLALTVLAGLVLAGCPKKIELSEEGKKVEFIENVEVIKDKLENPEQCQLVASLRITAMGSTSSVKKKSRLTDEAKDRMIRARNAAARNEGNVLITDGEVQGRSRKFKAYKCK